MVKASQFGDLAINPGKVQYIIAKTRIFDAKQGGSDPNRGSNASDDGMREVREDLADDAGALELIEFIRSLDEDEQVSLVALAWLGRGIYDATEWIEALTKARAVHDARTAEYLTGMPMLGDYLEEGLARVVLDGNGFDLTLRKKGHTGGRH